MHHCHDFLAYMHFMLFPINLSMQNICRLVTWKISWKPTFEDSKMYYSWWGVKNHLILTVLRLEAKLWKSWKLCPSKFCAMQHMWNETVLSCPNYLNYRNGSEKIATGQCWEIPAWQTTRKVLVTDMLCCYALLPNQCTVLGICQKQKQEKIIYSI